MSTDELKALLVLLVRYMQTVGRNESTDEELSLWLKATEINYDLAVKICREK